jgi:hypothetical protein
MQGRLASSFKMENNKNTTVVFFVVTSFWRNIENISQDHMA